MEEAQKTVHVKTFGCQMNVYDSERMANILAEKGYGYETDLPKADVILLNTCSIRENAENKVLTLLGQLKPLKEKYPEKVIGVAGCVGQRLGRQLLQKVPHLDIVMGPDNVEQVGELLDEVVHRGRRVVLNQFEVFKRQYSQPSIIPLKTKPSEFLTVMKGCDHFCTYCIVPFVRGREKSRPIAELIHDVEQLVARGTKEVVFLGQNINTYGKGSQEDLTMLIEAANAVPGLERIRYVTSHPRDLTEAMMAQFGTVEKLCPSLHLPFQAGSDVVLKRMGRLYNREEYLYKIGRLKHHRPDIAMSADIIVGFPGETEEDFKQTLEVLDEVKFSSVFMFKYSPRPGTRAFAYQDEVPEPVKEERLARAQDIVYSHINAENKAMLGSKIEVLVESMDKKGRYFMGRTPHGKVAHVLNAGSACVGKLLTITVSEANSSNIKGYYDGAPRIDRTASVETAISQSL